MAPEMQSQVDGTIRSVFDPTTCVRKGLCPMESHSLYYEQHGSGPEKIIFIMGLNTTSFAWASQVEYFGKLPEYSLLVFDNRGVGLSGAPRGPYTTSGMAEDVIVLLDYLEWTEPRDIHVVGISLGGMIAQELATRIPHRIVSLTLAVTTAGGHPWTNLPPWKGVTSLTKILGITDLKVKIPILLDMAYPREWLEEKAENDPAGRTNEEHQTEAYRRRIEITKPQTLTGSLSQMAAGITHHVEPSRLRAISSGTPKVLILTGDNDNLVDPKNSRHLHTHMPEAEFIVFQGTGHGIHIQRKDKFNSLLVKVFQEGKERAGHSYTRRDNMYYLLLCQWNPIMPLFVNFWVFSILPMRAQ